MADNEFDLGEAYSNYEQAKADRNFYLSMVQGGTQMASPIAAYLAGVAGVKMAGERAKVQNIEDNIQAKKDAVAATERLQKRQDSLRTQLVSIVKGVQDGTIPASVGATMVGHVGKELGIRVKQYIPAEGKLVYNEGSDPTDLQWDWRESPTAKEKGIQSRAEQRIAWEREKQQAGIEGQIKVASARKGASGSGSEGKTSLAGFKSAHDKVLRAVGKEALIKMLDYGQVKDFVEGLEGLSASDRKQMQGKADSILKVVKAKHPEWVFASPIYNPSATVSNKNVKVF